VLPQGKFLKKLFNTNAIKLSNGHSPQICETRSLLLRMCQGESDFSQEWPLANVGESGVSKQNRLENVGVSCESVEHGLGNVGESGEYLPSLLLNVGSSKIGRFMHK